MHSQIEVISPAAAKEYLERRVTNRRINDGTVTRYADDMRSDNFENNGQAIIFNEEGRMLDGQHRMAALIRSGKTLAFMVTRGVPTKAMQTLDTNRVRTVQDVLTLKGYKNTIAVSGAGRLMWDYAAGVGIQYSPSKGVLVKFIENHPKYVLDATVWVEGHKQHLFPRAPVIAILGLATESAQLNEEAKKFAKAIFIGEGLYKGDPCFTLRRFMDNLRASHKYSGGSVAVPAFAATARAWTAYAQGQSLEALKFAPNPTKENTKIFGYTDEDWQDVPDLRARQEEMRLANLEKGPKFQSAIAAAAKAAQETQVVRPPSAAA